MEPSRVTTIAFVACIERGELEKKTILLCRSIRRFAGRHAGAPIYTFQPREGTAISRDTALELADLGVHHTSERLNTAFAHYAIGNKIFASARAEQLASEDVLVFLDSDSVILDEPRAFELHDGIDAAVCPVDFHHSREEPESDDDPFWRTRFRRVGSSGPGDPMDAYWLRMYELLGIEARPFVETACSRQRIRAYFNSGMIAVRRSARLFAQWRDDFLGLMTAGHIPRKGPLHYMDQLSLAATLTRVWTRVAILNRRYNYGLPARDLVHEPLRSIEREALVHIHYNSMFDTVAQWLEPQLEEVACS
jgi:hypothetical protein